VGREGGGRWAGKGGKERGRKREEKGIVRKPSKDGL